MNATHIFSRTFVAILSIFLMAAVAVGQNLVLSGGASSYGGTWKVKGNIDNTSATGTKTFTGTVQLKGVLPQSMGGSANAINFATLTATGASVKTFNTASTIATAIDMTTGTTTQFAVAASTKLTLQGTIANTGGATTPYVFSNSGAEVDYAGVTQSVLSGITYDKLTVGAAGTKSLVGAVTVASALAVSAGDLSIGANTLTVNGTYTVAGTVTGGATSNLTLAGTGDVTSFSVTNGLNNMTLNRNTYTVTLAAPLTVAGVLALNNGTLAVSTQTLTLSGSVTAAGSGALTSAAAGTVDYATGAQNVLAANYGNLSFTLGNKTLPTSGTVGIAGTFTPGPGTHTTTSSTVNFNGGTQNIPAFSYNNLTTSGAGSAKTATGNLTIAGTFDNGGASNDAVTLAMGTNTISVTGDNTSSTIKFSGAANGKAFNTGTVEYNGDDVTTQTIGAGAYATLALSRSAGAGTAAKMIAADAAVTTSASFTVATNTSLQLVVPSIPGTTHTTLDVTGSMTVNGSLDNAGEISTTVDFNVNGSITNSGTITVGL